jgi:hypothetical protein
VLTVGVAVLLYNVRILGRTLPAVLATLALGTACLAAVGLAVAAFAPNGQTFSVVALATLLPLSFISNIFIIGGDLPRWVEIAGWLFPLKHLANAMADAFNPTIGGSGFAWGTWPWWPPGAWRGRWWPPPCCAWTPAATGSGSHGRPGHPPTRCLRRPAAATRFQSGPCRLHRGDERWAPGRKGFRLGWMPQTAASAGRGGGTMTTATPRLMLVASPLGLGIVELGHPRGCLRSGVLGSERTWCSSAPLTPSPAWRPRSSASAMYPLRPVALGCRCPAAVPIRTGPLLAQRRAAAGAGP